MRCTRTSLLPDLCIAAHISNSNHIIISELCWARAREIVTEKWKQKCQKMRMRQPYCQTETSVLGDSAKPFITFNHKLLFVHYQQLKIVLFPL